VGGARDSHRDGVGEDALAKDDKQKTNIRLSVTVKPFDLKTNDDLLADGFLWGWINPTFKTRARSYFAEGGALELKARQALIRVLRSDQPLSPTLRKHLAELFEVKSTTTERRLVFALRSNSMAKQDIASFVKRERDELGGEKNADGLAISRAAEHFGVTAKTIYKHIKKSPPVGRKG
jgi:hypothetical protein